MIPTYDSLNIATIAPIGFDDPEQALRILQGLAGHDVADALFNRLLDPLTTSLARAADPSRALRNFAAWIDRSGSRAMYYDLLASQPPLMEALLAVLGASQYLAEILFRNPEYFEVLANPRIRDRSRSMDDMLADARRRLAVATSPGMRLEALRMFKPPEALRIASRDLLGYATVEETIAEISDFAEACVRASLDICDAGDGFAVIGMGKLGGRELNYASDIDLIFVHADRMEQAQASKLGEAVRDTLDRVTPSGFVFRVDLRLRPEGRFGAISRSLSSCRAYYESWAESWERQALLKARLVGGDSAVGDEFLKIARGFVFANRVQEQFVEEIRNNKRMLERQTARNGESETNVKQGVGGIRDIEFTVQLLQLLAGGRNPQIVTGNTMQALSRLSAIGLISESEAAAFADCYLFLRNVEHRLQLMDERPIRNIPSANPAELDKFGKRLGYASGPAFLADYRVHAATANRLFTEIFYGAGSPPQMRDECGRGDEVAEWLATIEDNSSRAALDEHLRRLGFRDPGGALSILERSEKGTNYGEIAPAARESFAAVAGRMLEAASASGEPDEALRGLDQLATAAPSRAALYRSLAAEPELMQRLALLSGQAPFLFQVLLAHQEYVDMLSDPAEFERAVADVAGPGAYATPADLARGLAAFVRRERLRIGARDLWESPPVGDVMSDISALAQRALSAALRYPGLEEVSETLAIVGLGKLGGAELGYGSDLDVLWVRDEQGDPAQATRLAAALTALLNDGMTAYGVRWETDSRLRPDGRVGTLVRTAREFEAYYRGGGADAWEIQALIKTRFVAGDAAAGMAMQRLAREIVYSAPVSDQQAEAMRRMKGRIERERCKDVRDLKLGPGGLSDIEWTVQLLQRRHGGRWKKAQSPNTLEALAALRDAAVIRQDDWETLTDGYKTLTRLRNRLWMRGGRGQDIAHEQQPDLLARRSAVRGVFERLFANG